jgi:hypothetical protein
MYFHGKGESTYSTVPVLHDAVQDIEGTIDHSSSGRILYSEYRTVQGTGIRKGRVRLLSMHRYQVLISHIPVLVRKWVSKSIILDIISFLH